MKNTKAFQGPALCVSKVNGEKEKNLIFFSISIGGWGQSSVARSAIPEIFIAGASLYETEAIPLFFQDCGPSECAVVQTTASAGAKS